MTNPMLSALLGGLELPTFPCAWCVDADAEGRLADGPANGSTLVAGTLVCIDHVPHAITRSGLRSLSRVEVLERTRKDDENWCWNAACDAPAAPHPRTDNCPPAVQS